MSEMRYRCNVSHVNCYKGEKLHRIATTTYVDNILNLITHASSCDTPNTTNCC